MIMLITTGNKIPAKQKDVKHTVDTSEDGVNREQNEDFKQQANKLFKDGKFKEAVEKYNLAITAADKENERYLALLHGNLAECYLKLEDYSEALQSAQRSLGLDPTSVKVGQL